MGFEQLRMPCVTGRRVLPPASRIRLLSTRYGSSQFNDFIKYKLVIARAILAGMPTQIIEMNDRASDNGPDLTASQVLPVPPFPKMSIRWRCSSCVGRNVLSFPGRRCEEGIMKSV